MEHAIGDVARLVGVTSRTLRHYDSIGLLPATRIAAGGRRFYDDAALIRLQQILVLRELGVALGDIGTLLAASPGDVPAELDAHAAHLAHERERMDRRIAAVRRTAERLRRGEALVAEEMFDGFEDPHRDEAIARWGEEHYDAGAQAWRDLGEDGRSAHQREHDAIGAGLAAEAARGADPSSDEVQALVDRHYRWVSTFWSPSAEAYRGLGSMYVEDERFAATYDAYGPGTATILRDAIAIYADHSIGT